MGKKKKLYDLRSKISCDAEKMTVLLKHIAFKTDNLLEANILAEIALEKTYKISKMSEKIGKILNH